MSSASHPSQCYDSFKRDDGFGPQEKDSISFCCSTWVMLNTLTRRLAKMPDEMRSKMEYLAPPSWQVRIHRCIKEFSI